LPDCAQLPEKTTRNAPANEPYKAARCGNPPPRRFGTWFANVHVRVAVSPSWCSLPAAREMVVHVPRCEPRISRGGAWDQTIKESCYGSSRYSTTGKSVLTRAQVIDGCSGRGFARLVPGERSAGLDADDHAGRTDALRRPYSRSPASGVRVVSGSPAPGRAARGNDAAGKIVGV